MDFESTSITAPNLTAAEIRQYPLHCAIVTTKTPSIAPIILAAHHPHAGNVHTRDIHGITQVHVAAAKENAHALRALLSLNSSGIAEDMKDRKNKDGITPLEALEPSMHSTRECTETLVGGRDTWMRHQVANIF
jgi:hypothetical protein